MPLFGAVAAALLALSRLGGLGAWITGTARLPFVIGVDRYLPKPMAALHPKYRTPHIALLTQSAIVSVILLAALSSATIHDTYLLLIDMTLILGFLPLLYIFATLPVMRRRAAGANEGVTLVPGGTFGCWLVAALGFCTTLLAIITSLVPPEHTSHPAVFFAKVFGGCRLLLGVGLVFYARGRRTASAPMAVVNPADGDDR